MDTANTQSNPLARAGLITGMSLILGLSFNYLFYGKFPGVSFPLYIILIIAGLFGIAGFLKQKISKQTLWLLIPILFFSAMVFVRSSYLLVFLNSAASFLLLLVIAEATFSKKIREYLANDYLKILFLPFIFLRPLFKTLSDLFSLRGIRDDKKILSQITKGIAMTIPVLVVFLLLFSSADLVFKKYLIDTLNIDIKPETFQQVILVLFASLALIGAFSYVFTKRENVAVPQKENKYNIGHIENAILFGLVNILFLIFIIIQLTYLFGGEANIFSQGFTYAQYARRGFFELIAVAIISLALLLIAEKYIVKKGTGHALAFKILSSTLILQVILIMASAFMRLSLYEAAYGFTTLRLYSHAFIILLAAIFCLLLYKIYKDKRENTFAFRVFVLIILFLAVMNFLNPDAFIARKNIERFTATNKLDAYYLGRLSGDAIPETIKMLGISNEDLRKRFAHELHWLAQDIDSPYFSKWQSFNISRMRAKKILDSRMVELEPYKDYQQENPDFSESAE